MTEIEIYTKIMEIVDAEDAQTADVALEFVQRKIQNKVYANQQAANYLNQGCAQGLAGAQCDYQAKERERAYEEVRKIVSEEISKQFSAPEAEAK